MLLNEMFGLSSMFAHLVSWLQLYWPTKLMFFFLFFMSEQILMELSKRSYN